MSVSTYLYCFSFDVGSSTGLSIIVERMKQGSPDLLQLKFCLGYEISVDSKIDDPAG